MSKTHLTALALTLFGPSACDESSQDLKIERAEIHICEDDVRENIRADGKSVVVTIDVDDPSGCPMATQCLSGPDIEDVITGKEGYLATVPADSDLVLSILVLSGPCDEPWTVIACGSAPIDGETIVNVSLDAGCDMQDLRVCL